MTQKVNMTADELRDRAIAYLGRSYKGDYVKERMATGSYPREWDVIIQAYEAGTYETISKLIINDLEQGPVSSGTPCTFKENPDRVEPL